MCLCSALFFSADGCCGNLRLGLGFIWLLVICICCVDVFVLVVISVFFCVDW